MEETNKRIGWKTEVLVFLLSLLTTFMWFYGYEKVVTFLLIWIITEIGARQAKHLGY